MRPFQIKENQALRPVTLATTRARYDDNTLYTLPQSRDRDPLVPQNLCRPPMSCSSPTQHSLIWTISFEDDNDNEWNTDLFEYPDHVDCESPEELVALKVKSW